MIVFWGGDSGFTEFLNKIACYLEERISILILCKFVLVQNCGL